MVLDGMRGMGGYVGGLVGWLRVCDGTAVMRGSAGNARLTIV